MDRVTGDMDRNVTSGKYDSRKKRLAGACKMTSETGETGGR